MSASQDGTGDGPTLATAPWEGSRGRAVLFLCGRYLLAFLMLGYGFTKVVGLQFLVTDSMLDSRLRDLAGMELVWAYHGSSPVLRYGTALAELIAGSLLLFRRTTRLGLYATLLVGMQVLLVNLAWPIAPLSIVFILSVTIAMLAADRQAVNAMIRDHLLEPPPVANSHSDGGAFRRPAWLKTLVVLVLVGLAIGGNVWLRGVNTPDPTLSGVWESVDDPEIERLYIDDAPYCAARFHDDPVIWRGVCFIDQNARTLTSDLQMRASDTGAGIETWELDATYTLHEGGTHLVLDVHHRGRSSEFLRLR